MIGAGAPDELVLLAARIIEGVGFLGVALAIPSMLARLVERGTRDWSAYMPTGCGYRFAIAGRIARSRERVLRDGRGPAGGAGVLPGRDQALPVCGRYCLAHRCRSVPDGNCAKADCMGADVRARNRRGAEPLHYAVDGMPGSDSWKPRAQAATIACLIEAGADPNAVDKSGVTPLHRAVRTRCAAAVKALLDKGADARHKNKSGSTPMLLATQSTGRGGSGSPEAKA